MSFIVDEPYPSTTVCHKGLVAIAEVGVLEGRGWHGGALQGVLVDFVEELGCCHKDIVAHRGHVHNPGILRRNQCLLPSLRIQGIESLSVEQYDEPAGRHL